MENDHGVEIKDVSTRTGKKKIQTHGGTKGVMDKYGGWNILHLFNLTVVGLFVVFCCFIFVS